MKIRSLRKVCHRSNKNCEFATRKGNSVCKPSGFNQNINGTGKIFFHITASFAEYERSIIQERTKAGLKAARSRGRTGGRPKAISDEKFKIAKKLYDANSDTVLNICKSLDINRRTFYKYLNDN